MNDYERKRQQRIDGLRERADRKRAEAQAVQRQAMQRADAIPMGQPILVGHHSEKRDRKYRERISRGFEKAADLAGEASELERRAKSAERNRAVSSDDPDAVAKLQRKLDSLNASRALMVAANKIIRKGGDDRDAQLRALGLRDDQIAKIVVPDFAGRIGFPDYAISNTGADARRVQKRIEELQAKAATPAAAPEEIGDVRIEESDNRVRIYFPGKPSDATRAALKARGFKWSPTAEAWQRMASVQAWAVAREIARSLMPAGEEPTT